MGNALRVLHLEDDPRDAEIVREVLEAGGIACDITRVETGEEFVASLERGGFDAIFADYSLPSFDGMSALKIAAQRWPDVPFIFISGALGEERAIEALKLGATDYVLKERPSRMVGAVRRALREAQHRAERKQADEALRASEERFRTLVQFSFDVYWETDAQHRFIRQEFAENLADAPAPGSEIGKTLWEAPYLEPDEEAWRRHRATLDAHLPFRDFELARPTPDGGKRYVSVSGLPVSDEAGRFIGYRGVGRDVTERKLAEEERRAHLRFLESMDRINRAMQGSNDLERMMSDVLDAVLEVFACDRAWLVYPCEPEAASWRAVMEHTRPQFPGVFALGADLPVDAETAAVFRAVRDSSVALSFGRGYDRQLPADVVERFSIRSQIAMALHPKVDQPYLFGLHQCSRERVWTAQETRLFEEIGRRLADALTSLLVFRTLRESERKLDAAQRIAHLGYWERDFVKGSVALSDEVRQLFGDATDLRQFDERALERVHPEDRPRFADAFTAARRGGPPYDLEYRVVRPDGALRIVHSQGGYVTRDESGQPIRMFGAIQDITELRRAEEELRASEARFRRLTGLSADWYWKQDESLRFTYFSSEVDEKAGYAAALSLGRTRWELPITPLSGSWDEHRAALAAHQPFRDFEYSRIDQNGRTRNISVSGVPVFDERGAFKGYDGVASDITPRKLAEQALRESEARFRTFVDHATDAFMLHDTDGAIIDVNRRACETLGYGRDELIGRLPIEFDATETPPELQGGAERLDAGDVVTFERRFSRKDGSVFPGEVRVRGFWQGGKRLAISLLHDITERKQAEQRLLAQHRVTQILAQAATLEEATPKILQALGECLAWDAGELWGVDRDGGVLRCVEVWHTAAVEIAQFEAATWTSTFNPAVGLPGRVWSSRVPVCIPDCTQEPGFVRAPAAALAGLRAAFGFPILLAKEVLGVVDLFSREVREPDQDLLEAMATIGSQIGQFIERKRAEAGLFQAQAALAHLTRVLTMGELAASIAHEVNQPLAAMVNSAASCLRWLEAERPRLDNARRALERIAKDGERATEVIGRIRALVQRQAPTRTPFDLNETIREVVALTRYEMRRNDIALVARLAEDLSPVRGDRIQVQQVILNLVVNAIEAMSSVEDRRRELVIASAPERKGGLLLAVQDSGTGLDPASADRLFEAFYTTKAHGIGIGLSISRTIIEAHGGRLWATPNTPHGAVFQFWLPVEGASDEQPTASSTDRHPL